MIAFRVFSKESKAWVKWLHMIIQAIAFAFGCAGLKAVFDFHTTQDSPHMYSLHSWIGMGSFVLFTCQVYQYLQHSVICSSKPIFYFKATSNQSNIWIQHCNMQHCWVCLSIIMLDHDDVASGLVIQYYRTNNDAQV